MFRWHYFPFLRLTIYLIVGILFYSHASIQIDEATLWGVTGVLFLFSLLFLRSDYRSVKGILAACTIVFLGYWLAHLNDPYLDQDHYIHADSPPDEFYGTVVQPGEQRDDFIRYKFKLNGDSSGKKSGKIYLYVKDSVIRYVYGDQLMVCGRIQPISPPKNPYEFNYRKYLQQKGITGTVFPEPGFLKKTGRSVPNQLLALAYHIRSELSTAFDSLITNAREREIALALILGIKDNLNRETREAYATAGAMHVLAVSGLHVGIVYLILSAILGKIFFIERTRVIKLFIILTGILFYAILTGMSASVLRASVMFSVVAVGNTLYRNSSVYNSLGIAAFILLLIDPNLVYSVGFQLSFAAVLGIVGLFPFLSQWVNSKYFLVNKLWQLTSVSIAAQLATLPFSLYYFHQFPTYFFLSNIIVIPAAFIILLGGILILLLYFISFPFLGHLVILYERIIWLMNESIFLLEQLPNSLINWIYLTKIQVICLYGTLVLLSTGFYYRSRSAFLGLFFLTGFLILGLHRSLKLSKQKRLLIYSAEQIIIDKIDGRNSSLYLVSELNDKEGLTYSLNPLRRALGLSDINEALGSSRLFSTIGPFKYAQVADYRFLFISEEMVEYRFHSPVVTDFLILSPQLKGDFSRLISNISFKTLLIQGAMPPWRIDELKTLCKEKGVIFHNLNEDGFLDLS